MSDDEFEPLPDIMLDELIAKLQRIRRHVKRDMPLRVADAYDNALPVLTISLEKNCGWEGEPENEPYVCLCIG
jgi:hypothetical protein